jgi:phenylacetate-CoA ligase
MATRAEIETRQWSLLQEVLRRVPAETFYGRKFAGVTRPNSLNDFKREFPFTTKVELAEDQRAHPPFGTVLLEPIEHYTRLHQTSGTTSSPMRWLDTHESWTALTDSWMQVFKAAGVTAKDRVFFAFSFGPFLGFWMAYDAANRLGCLCLPAGGMTSAARVRMLIDTQATVLCCTPTYAARLAEAAVQENVDLGKSAIRRIMVAGEAGGSLPAVRAQLERLWQGARIFDHHGMTEVGPVTYECPLNSCRLHVMEDAFVAEILDPKTNEPDQTGELVLTTVVRTGSPLFRYRTGDQVRALEGRCSCGSENLSLEGGILGRLDDMAVVRGVNIFPSAVEEVIRSFPEISEYRVMQKNPAPLTELEIQIEAPVDSAPRLQKALQTAFALRIPVQTVASGSLPRSEMKSKRWIRQ